MRSPPGRQVAPPSRVKPDAFAPFVGRGEVAADDHASRGLRKASENTPPAGGGGDRRVGDRPGAAAVARVEHARGAAAGGEPGVAARWSRGRCRWRRTRTRPRRRPACRRSAARASCGRQSSVAARRNLPSTGSLSASPRRAAGEEGHAVVEGARVVVDERGRPGAAAVEGRVDPRLGRPRRSTARSRADALAASTSRNSRPGAAGRGDVLPGAPAVGRAQHLAGAAADPRDARADAVEAAVLLVGAGGDGHPARSGGAGRVGGGREGHEHEGGEDQEAAHRSAACPAGSRHKHAPACACAAGGQTQGHDGQGQDQAGGPRGRRPSHHHPAERAPRPRGGGRPGAGGVQPGDGARRDRAADPLLPAARGRPHGRADASDTTSHCPFKGDATYFSAPGAITERLGLRGPVRRRTPSRSPGCSRPGRAA